MVARIFLHIDSRLKTRVGLQMEHNQQDRVIVTDPLKIKFLYLIRCMSPRETAAVGELIRAMVDHKSADIVHEASLRVAHAMGISEARAAEVTNRFMQRLDDEPIPAPTIIAKDQERLCPSDRVSPQSWRKRLTI